MRFILMVQGRPTGNANAKSIYDESEDWTVPTLHLQKTMCSLAQPKCDEHLQVHQHLAQYFPIPHYPRKIPLIKQLTSIMDN